VDLLEAAFAPNGGDSLEAKCRELLVELTGGVLKPEVYQRTPARMAKAYREMLAGENLDAAEVLGTPFLEDHDELVQVRDIPFAALCEHHLLPFVGVAHVGYIPNGKVVGLSKFVRVVQTCARRLTLQEHLTTEVAEALERAAEPLGVMVVVEAEHTCMTVRGVQAPGTRTTTSAVRGVFRDKAEARAEFLRLLGR
jgi:GTP cyclohydrolase I